MTLTMALFQQLLQCNAGHQDEMVLVTPVFDSLGRNAMGLLCVLLKVPTLQAWEPLIGRQLITVFIIIYQGFHFLVLSNLLELKLQLSG